MCSVQSRYPLLPSSMISLSTIARRVHQALHNDRSRFRWAIVLSLALHILLSVPLALLVRHWFPSGPQVVLPRVHHPLEISLLEPSHQPTQRSLRQDDRVALSSAPPREDRTEDLSRRAETPVLDADVPAADSIGITRQLLATKVDSLFALLEEYPELRRVVFRELLTSQPLLKDSTEDFRFAVARSLARFYEGSVQYGSLQRKDAI